MFQLDVDYFSNTSLDYTITILKHFFITIFSIYTCYKISGLNFKFCKKSILYILLMAILSVPITYIKFQTNNTFIIVLLMIVLSFLFKIIEKKDYSFSILITILSLCINYIVYFIATILCFIPNILVSFHNDFINVFIIFAIHLLLIICLFKIRRIKNGFSFLSSKFSDDYINMFIINIGLIIILSYMLFSVRDTPYLMKILPIFVLFYIIMFITLKNSITLSYKHNLLIKDLNDTKEELKDKNKEIESLESENLELGKISHSIAHKQKVLEYKLNKLALNTEIGPELDVSKDLENIANSISKVSEGVTLSKTDINEIDDMLNYMQSECLKDKIDFNLKVYGNIHYMVNNIIDKDDLQILLADHIKDAIIAINHSKNINRSIQIKLGLVNDVYSLYIYDSGIEFDLKTLLSLGTKPITTHKNEGGTGLGFMNTFDCLEKYKASLCIDEIGKPIKDNYTKAIIIKFDKQNKRIITSYRLDKIKKHLNGIDSKFDI